MFDVIIIRYGEIGLKSESVRRRFEDKLIRNIILAFRKESIIDVRIKKERGRIFLRSKNMEKAKNVLKRIFGIVSISPAVETIADIEDIKEKALELIEKRINGIKTFAVRSTRVGKHDFTSQDIAIEVGREIKEKFNLRVDLDDPDLELYIEVRDDKAYLFFEKIRGPAGLPLGSQGKVLSLVRNKRDILALWCMLRRGCSAKVISYGMDKELKDFLRKWYAESETEIAEEKDIKRNMNGCLALVVGESMRDIDFDRDKNFNLPILRPLVSFSDEEIDRMIGEIGI